MASRKYSIILTNGQQYEVWSAFTTLCEAHNFPYHTLKNEDLPLEYEGLTMIKVKDNTKIISSRPYKLPNSLDVKINLHNMILMVERLANVNSTSELEAGKQQAYSHIYFELRKMLDKLYH